MIEIELTLPHGLTGLPEAIRQILPDIAEAIHNDINTRASRELGSSSLDYTSSLSILHVPVSPAQLVSGQATFASVVLTGWLANAVESGWGGGDMKPGILAGRSAKQAEDGTRYAIVPFRHMTPGTTGRSGQAMGTAEVRHGGLSRSDAELLGRKVHRAAKRLSKTTSHPQHGTQWGERLKAGAGGSKPLQNRSSGYQHKTDPYAGMVRQEKTYQASSQSSYVTFRAVSDKSDPSSWQHPGILRHDFFGQAQKEVPKIVKMAMTSVIRGLNRGGTYA